MTADAVHAHHKASFTQYIEGVAARITLTEYEIETAETDYAAGFLAGMQYAGTGGVA